MADRPDDQKYKVPDADEMDYMQALIEGGLSCIPVAGGLVAKLFSMLEPSLQVRRNKWMMDVALGLKALEDKVESFKVENIVTDPTFVTVLLNAVTIAVRTHQQEKLDALRNAVLNSPLGKTPDENLQLVFLNLIDGFTELHIRLLFIAHHMDKHRKHFPPDLWEPMAMSEMLDKTIPEVPRELWKYVANDLLAKNLTDISYDSIVVPSAGTSHLTDLGVHLAEFISSPFDE